MTLKRVLIRWCVIPSVIFVLFTLLANVLVMLNARGKTFDYVDNVPVHRVGLVLGTSKRLVGGYANPYFYYRVQAAAEAFLQNKVQYLLLSGDNGTRSYNEPFDLQMALVQAGVPQENIVLDHAGFRTLDSVVRAKEVFGQKKLLIISQKFHNDRAIYLAEHYGIDATGFNAKTPNKKYGWKVLVREYFARVKVFIDIVFNVQPKFLGEPIAI